MITQQQTQTPAVDPKVQADQWNQQMQYQRESFKAQVTANTQSMAYAHQEAIAKQFVPLAELIAMLIACAFVVIYLVHRKILADLEVAKIEAAKPTPPEPAQPEHNEYHHCTFNYPADDDETTPAPANA